MARGTHPPAYTAASRSLPGLEGNFLYSRSLVEEVTEKRLAALVMDAASDQRFADAPSMLAVGARSLVAAPLLDPEGCVGMIALSSRTEVRQFTEADLELLVSLASVAAVRLRNATLAEDAAQHWVLEGELALARRLQLALLPDELPRPPGYELKGITEAENPEGEELGLQRLEELVCRRAGEGLADFAAALEAELVRFVRGVPFADDRTLLLLRRLPRS